jgi:ribosomal protein L11 methyltransferase
MRIWSELELEVATDRAEELGAVLMALGATGVESAWRAGEAPPLRQPWDRGAAAADPATTVLRTWWERSDRARVERELQVRDLRGTWREVDEASWSEWQRHFHRLVVTADFAVAPPWEARPGDLVVEPGLAFGTGEHPTTRMCLEAILAAPKRVARPRCLDVGTGSGVLALCAARAGWDAFGLDVDPDSIATARANAAHNRLEARFELGSLERVEGVWDLVVANLYAELLVEHAHALVALAAGRIVLSGITADRAPSVRAAFSSQPLVEERTVDGWTLLVYDRTA